MATVTAPTQQAPTTFPAPQPLPCPPVQKALEWLSTLRPWEIAQLGGPTLQDMGIPEPLSWLNTTANPLGHLIYDRLASPFVLKAATRLSTSPVHSRDPQLLGTCMCRLAALDLLTQ